MKKILIGLLLLSPVSAFADTWTCSAVCGEIYDFKVTDVRGHATNVGTGKTPGEAIESLAEVCTTFGRSYFPIFSYVTGDKDSSVVYANVANACIKN